MEQKIELVKELAQKAEDFARTNIELYKLKAIDKGTDVFSSVASAIIIGIIVIFSVLILSIGLAVWIGQALGNIAYGFLIVGGLYLLMALVLFLTRKTVLDNFFNDYIVRLIFKEKDHEGDKK